MKDIKDVASMGDFEKVMITYQGMEIPLLNLVEDAVKLGKNSDQAIALERLVHGDALLGIMVKKLMISLEGK